MRENASEVPENVENVSDGNPVVSRGSPKRFTSDRVDAGENEIKKERRESLYKKQIFVSHFLSH